MNGKHTYIIIYHVYLSKIQIFWKSTGKVSGQEENAINARVSKPVPQIVINRNSVAVPFIHVWLLISYRHPSCFSHWKYSNCAGSSSAKACNCIHKQSSERGRTRKHPQETGHKLWKQRHISQSSTRLFFHLHLQNVPVSINTMLIPMVTANPLITGLVPLPGFRSCCICALCGHHFDLSFLSQKFLNHFNLELGWRSSCCKFSKMRGIRLIGEANMCSFPPILNKSNFSWSVSGSHENYRNCDLPVAFSFSFLLMKYKLA